MPAVDEASKWFDFLKPAIEWGVHVLGPGWFVALLVAMMAGSGLTRWLANRRLDKGFQAALDEKERTIQRLADEVRGYRVALFKRDLGWTDEEVTKYLLNNAPPETKGATPIPKADTAKEPLPERKRKPR